MLGVENESVTEAFDRRNRQNAEQEPMMTEDKPIAKPIIDDATREKMALMFSGEVYLPDDVDGFLICRPPSVISSSNSTPHR